MGDPAAPSSPHSDALKERSPGVLAVFPIWMPRQELDFEMCQPAHLQLSPDTAQSWKWVIGVMRDLIWAATVSALTGSKAPPSLWRLGRCRMKFPFQKGKESPQKCKKLANRCYLMPDGHLSFTLLMQNVFLHDILETMVLSCAEPFGQKKTKTLRKHAEK